MTTSRPTLFLDGTWQLAVSDSDHPVRLFSELPEAADGGARIFAATVPGNVELDLQAAGELPEDFYCGLNILQVADYENKHFWYATTFSGKPTALPRGRGEGVFEPWLRFEGIDCLADIFLNGERIGSADNALIEHEFPVGAVLKDGANELLVHLRPVITEDMSGVSPAGAWHAFPFGSEGLRIRKAPHCFGWDIMPRAVSAGLWRPVSLVWKPRERIEHVFLETVSADIREGHLNFCYDTRLSAPLKGCQLRIEGTCVDSHFEETVTLCASSGRYAFRVASPRRWWPRNRGNAELYTVVVRLMREGRELDRISFRHGIRTVNFRRSEALDENGNGEFTCIVNGEPIFVMGTNHVPADVFHSRDVEHIPHIIGLAEEAGCNLIRCWGGNVYEHESFFDLCDEKGILVWQDFSMACAVYPQDDAFVRKLEREAVAVIRRLRQHACLALWCGDNECDLVPDWAERPLDRSRNRLTREVIPAALRANDPLRSYVPSSPYVSPEVERRGQRFMPENHLWGPRDYYKSAFYQNSLSLFVSEIGYHACPVPVSMQRFLTPGNVWPVGVHSSGMHDESCVAGAASANPEWLLHATTPVPGFDTFDYRIALMFDQVRFLFGSVPQDMEEFSLASQCVQAEANKFFIEWFRGGHHPSRRRTGIVWWNLRDGWPQFSDAVVDYYYEKKLAFDMIRRAQSPVLVMLREPNGWTQDIVICNDLRVGRELSVRIINLDTDRVVWEKYRIYAPGDGVTVAGSLPCTQSEQGCYLIEWDDVDPIVLASPGDSSSVVNSIPANVSGKSHYLNGLPAFSFSRYSEWLCKAGFMSLNTRRCPNVIKHKEASLY